MNNHTKKRHFHRKDKLKKARERKFPRVPVSLETPTPEDLLLIEGKLQDTARLVHLAQSNIQSLNLKLLECAVLDPANRFAVVNHILYTSNSKISLRRKFDLISKSIEVHYYSQRDLQIIRTELANLLEQLLRSLEREAQIRFDEILKNLDGRSRTQLARVKGDISLIARAEVFKVSSVPERQVSLFWELASFLSTSFESEKEQGAFKHANDVSHSKLNAIFPVKKIGDFAAPEGVDSYCHPLIAASIYKFRIHTISLVADFNQVVSELNVLRQNFENLIQQAEIKEEERKRLDEERSIAIERERAIRAELLKEIGKKRQEELEKLAIERGEIISKLLENDLKSPDGYHWSGAGWVSNNSRYQKGG